MKTKIEKGEKYQSLKSKIVILLQKRKDLTRHGLAALLNKNVSHIDVALTHLRKAGFHIWPSKGPGTPLKIATSQLESEKYINWRRRVYLDTAHRMIITEVELGEQYRTLSSSPKQLLNLLSDLSGK